MNARIFVLIFIVINLFFTVAGCQKDHTSKILEKHNSTEKHNLIKEHTLQEKGSPFTLSKESQEASGIRIALVKHETVREKVKVGGEAQLDPQLQAKITPRVAGTVSSFHVKVGDSVHKGDPLMTLYSREVAEIRAMFSQAKSRLSLAKTKMKRPLHSPALSQAEIVEAKANLEVAEKNLNRAESLVEDKIISQKDYELAKAEVEKAKAKLLIAKRDYSGFHGEYQEARITLEKETKILESLGVPLKGEGGFFTLVSPIDGIVTEQSVSLGEGVEPVTHLLTILKPDPLWIVVDIYEKDFSKIKVGQKVFLKTAAFNNKAFTGTVSYISPMLEPHVRTAKARIVLINHDHLLKVGIFLQGEIVVAEHTQAVIIPHEALSVEEGQNIVYVEKNPGTFEPRTVTLGIDEGEQYEVIQGLKAGERIVVEGGFFIKSERQKEKIGEED